MTDQNCIFCKIVAGEIPCAKVYETGNVLAFLDIAPVNRGHALVIPKEHHPQLWDLPGGLGDDLLKALQRVGKAVMAATGAAGVNVMMNNHEAAGQIVMHAHFHLIPRFEDDGLRLWPQGGYGSMEEMGELAKAVAGCIEGQ